MKPEPQPLIDGLTIIQTLRAFEEAGFKAQFGATEDGIRCYTCRVVSPSADFQVEALERMEGASDPDDMVAVMAVECPACHVRGTLMLKYGAESSPEDQQALAQLPGVQDNH